ncbi:MAG: hypothetical protein HC802_04020 [Caldilineaceae bacterium]|nr:hypothetical protein [Caldilineaceae bacterium]
MTISLILRKVQTAGDLSADADIGYLADAILAPLNPKLFDHQRRVRGYELDEISRNLCNFLLNGLAG